MADTPHAELEAEDEKIRIEAIDWLKTMLCRDDTTSGSGCWRFKFRYCNATCFHGQRRDGGYTYALTPSYLTLILRR